MIFISPIYLCSLPFCQLSYHTSPYEYHKILSVLLKKFTMENNAHILDGKEELCGEKIIAPTSGNRNALITISVCHGILIAPVLYWGLWDSLEKKKYKTTSSIVMTLWNTELRFISLRMETGKQGNKGLNNQLLWNTVIPTTTGMRHMQLQWEF